MLQEREAATWSPDVGPPARQANQRAGGVTLWAAVGVLWVAFVAQALGGWMANGKEFSPAPIFGPDEFGGTELALLRLIEIGSLCVAATTIWVFLIRPWVRERRLGLDGMIVIGALLASAIDPLINYFHYTFAWNAHALNMGSWLDGFPMAQGSSRYAEGVAWAVPQYLYLGIGLAAIECRIIERLRERNPSISNVRSFAVASALIFLLDVAIEQLFVRTHIYAYPRTWEALTLWPGSEYQFPVYESVFVAIYAVGFTALRMSARDSSDGLSFVERGIHRIRASARTPVRLLAVIGFCAVWAALAYFVPWSWMSNNPDSLVDPPSYMLPGPEGR
jgi:Spirocyclase AveC-like